MGSPPQSSPSSCTGTSAPGALAWTSVEVKDLIARLRGLLAIIPAMTSGLKEVAQALDQDGLERAAGQKARA